MLTNILKSQKNLKNSYLGAIKFQKKQFVWNPFRKVKRHFDALLEPTHTDYASTIVDTNQSMYSNLRQFQSYLTKNAYDMSIDNEYDLWPHQNFGTIDNPLLVFGADTTWRLISCSGPGSEEESQTHEKMYFILREGPIHRCLFCGQCFKLVKLKDDLADEKNYFYSSIFTELSPKIVEEDEKMNTSFFFVAPHELPRNSQNITPTNISYAWVNTDEADHLMVDPAKRLEKYKDLEKEFVKIASVMNEIDKQSDYLRLSDRDKMTLPKDIYETWHDVEKAILKFDKVFNRYEKFAGRAGFDPENHERRESRMKERKAIREKENYTFYFNGLDEKEQMYRDYFETDLEEYPESSVGDEMDHEKALRDSGDFDMSRYDFVESNIFNNERSAVEGMIEKTLFKYKYRKVGDPKFESRNLRVMKRFFERAEQRDPEVVAEISDKLEKLYVNNQLNNQFIHKFRSLSQAKVDMPLTQQNYEEIMPLARYVAEEGLKQFLDYYETDEEEGLQSRRGELWEDLNENDKLLFAEHFENFASREVELDKHYVTIPKRPYDMNKSIVYNFYEDLVDFNSRVRPIARMLAFKNASNKYQMLPINKKEEEALENDERYRKVLGYTKTGKTLLDEVEEQQKTK